jgi:hypothetical protein
MKKEDFKVGMVVRFGSDRFGIKNMPRGVIIKINPKRAKIKTIDPAGRWPAGCIWSCHYSGLFPVVEVEEVSNEMTMRSFERPNDTAIKAWSAAQKSKGELTDSLQDEDEHIVRAIYELYIKLKDSEGEARFGPSDKIHLLFRALGREVSEEEARTLIEKIS